MVLMFTTLALMSSYTANLASALTTPQVKPRHIDVESLLKRKAKVGCEKDSFLVKYLKEGLGFHPDDIREYDYAEAVNYLEALKSGEIEGAFLEAPYVKLLLANNCKDFSTVGPTYKVAGFGFVSNLEPSNHL